MSNLTPKSLTATDKQLGKIVLEAYKRGYALQSNFFRDNAAHVAMAASLGLLTTRVAGNVYSSEWRPTIRGLRHIEKVYGKHYDATGLDEPAETE